MRTGALVPKQINEYLSFDYIYDHMYYDVCAHEKITHLQSCANLVNITRGRTFILCVVGFYLIQNGF